MLGWCITTIVAWFADSVHRRVPGGPVRVRRRLAALAHSPAGVPAAARRRLPAVFVRVTFDLDRFTRAQDGRRLRDGARRARGRTQTQSLDLVHLSAARRPGTVLRGDPLRTAGRRRSDRVSCAIACCATACFASRTRCSRNSSAIRRRPLADVMGSEIDAREARVVDDAVPRGRAADRRSGHRDAARTRFWRRRGIRAIASASSR